MKKYKNKSNINRFHVGTYFEKIRKIFIIGIDVTTIHRYIYFERPRYNTINCGR